MYIQRSLYLCTYRGLSICVHTEGHYNSESHSDSFIKQSEELSNLCTSLLVRCDHVTVPPVLVQVNYPILDSKNGTTMLY